MYDVDWLRVFGIATVFLFHCGKFFDKDGWHVKDAHVSQVATLAINVLSQWMMPLFFVLSGISVFHALARQTTGQFVFARFKRLAIPLLFGTFIVIAPIQVYLERVSHGQFSGSFFAFFPHYFEGWYGYGGNFAWMGLHLWYLEMLFIFSLILLPLFVAIGRESNQGLMTGIGRLCSKPGVVFLPAILVFAMEGVTRSDLVRNTVLGWRAFGGWPLPQHFLFFLLGYFVAAIPQLRKVIENNRIVALAMGIFIMCFAFWLILAKGHAGDGVFFAAVRSLNVIAWLIALLGFGSKYLNFRNNFLGYANEAVLPFYVLHQTVLVAVGFFIVRWNIGMSAKYLLIGLSSFVLIMAIYELSIKRMNALRFLFGMKPAMRHAHGS